MTRTESLGRSGLLYRSGPSHSDQLTESVAETFLVVLGEYSQGGLQGVRRLLEVVKGFDKVRDKRRRVR